jgi:hypothetical protein
MSNLKLRTQESFSWEKLLASAKCYGPGPFHCRHRGTPRCPTGSLFHTFPSEVQHNTQALTRHYCSGCGHCGDTLRLAYEAAGWPNWDEWMAQLVRDGVLASPIPAQAYEEANSARLAMETALLPDPGLAVRPEARKLMQGIHPNLENLPSDTLRVINARRLIRPNAPGSRITLALAVPLYDLPGRLCGCWLRSGAREHCVFLPGCRDRGFSGLDRLPLSADGLVLIPSQCLVLAVVAAHAQMSSRPLPVLFYGQDADPFWLPQLCPEARCLVLVDPRRWRCGVQLAARLRADCLYLPASSPDWVNTSAQSWLDSLLRAPERVHWSELAGRDGGPGGVQELAAIAAGTGELPRLEQALRQQGAEQLPRVKREVDRGMAARLHRKLRLADGRLFLEVAFQRGDETRFAVTEAPAGRSWLRQQQITLFGAEPGPDCRLADAPELLEVPGTVEVGWLAKASAIALPGYDLPAGGGPPRPPSYIGPDCVLPFTPPPAVRADAWATLALPDCQGALGLGLAASLQALAPAFQLPVPTLLLCGPVATYAARQLGKHWPLLRTEEVQGQAGLYARQLRGPWVTFNAGTNLTLYDQAAPALAAVLPGALQSALRGAGRLLPNLADLLPGLWEAHAAERGESVEVVAACRKAWAHWEAWGLRFCSYRKSWACLLVELTRTGDLAPAVGDTSVWLPGKELRRLRREHGISAEDLERVCLDFEKGGGLCLGPDGWEIGRAWWDLGVRAMERTFGTLQVS